jgi:hypothetical protein
VSSFAVMLSSKPASVDGILLLVDERGDAEAIAVELRRRGQPVTVREIKVTDRQFHNPAQPPAFGSPL